MNPEYCLLNLPDETSTNSQENVFNDFDIEHIPNNDNSNLDTNISNNKCWCSRLVDDVVDDAAGQSYRFWKDLLLEIIFLKT